MKVLPGAPVAAAQDQRALAGLNQAQAAVADAAHQVQHAAVGADRGGAAYRGQSHDADVAAAFEVVDRERGTVPQAQAGEGAVELRAAKINGGRSAARHAVEQHVALDLTFK